MAAKVVDGYRQDSRPRLSAVGSIRKPAEKFGARRDELGRAALDTLSQLGYARTGLREIAQNSGYSLGVLHYYFSDKNELIVHCIKQYKAECVLRYDAIVEQATTHDGLCEGFAEGLAETARNDGHMHRLWYDMRTQSMFEDVFRSPMLEIDASIEAMMWRVVTKYARLAGKEPIVSDAVAYALFDGLFQRALLGDVAGDAEAIPRLVEQVRVQLPALVR